MAETDISVVLACHNSADLLPTALAHLEVQTYPAGRFEILIVDAAGTDDTPAIVQRYASGAPVRTRYLPHESSASGAVRNLALHRAEGTWVLFLDPELLAAPGLVEAHVRAQGRHAGTVAALGAVALHPQLASNTFTKWSNPYGWTNPQLRQGHRVMDWGAYNLSLPRQTALESGGFDEDRALDGVEDLELGKRLFERGLRGCLAETALAYAWLPTRLDDERARHYRLGYALHTLECKTLSDEIRRRYPVTMSVFRQRLHRFGLPLCTRLCHFLSAETGVYGPLCRRILDCELQLGYYDACRGAPRRV